MRDYNENIHESSRNSLSFGCFDIVKVAIMALDDEEARFGHI